MAEFYGRVQGNRGEATRMGSKDSGLRATAETWTHVLEVEVRMDQRWDKPEHTSEHWSFFALRSKYGGAIFSIGFDGDLVAQHADDERVRAAIENVKHAFEGLDHAALAAAKDYSERRAAA